MREENVPLDLFGKQEKKLKNLAIEEVADKLREKYGEDIIKRVASMRKTKIEEKDDKKKKFNVLRSKRVHSGSCYYL